MRLQADITEYLAACSASDALYAEIGDNRALALARRNERWAANARKRTAAENIIMSMLGEHRSALSRAGLVELYEQMSAGNPPSDAAMYVIADATCKFYRA